MTDSRPADDGRIDGTPASTAIESIVLPSKPKRSRRRKMLYGASSIFGALLAIFLGVHIYLQVAERLNPSGRVYVSANGQRQYLEQPLAVVTPNSGQAEVSEATQTETGAPMSPSDDVVNPPSSSPEPVGTEVPTSTSQPPAGRTASIRPSGAATDVPNPWMPRPPLHLQIDAIGVDVPVVLADNQHLPRMKLAGWFFKSAFPATAGNIVLLGHVNGEAAIFERLHELTPNDQIRISTEVGVHVYVVDSIMTVDEKATEVLAPTSNAVVTLITCAGDWNPVTKTFSERLVVRGHYAAVEKLETQP